METTTSLIPPLFIHIMNDGNQKYTLLLLRLPH